METLQGNGVSVGIARGPLYFYRRPEYRISNELAADPDCEKERFSRAQEVTASQLAALAQRCSTQVDQDSAALFEAHAMFLEDAGFIGAIRSAIEERHCCAEYAVQAAEDQFSAMFSSLDDTYMQARSADIRDV